MCSPPDVIAYGDAAAFEGTGMTTILMGVVSETYVVVSLYISDCGGDLLIGASCVSDVTGEECLKLAVSTKLSDDIGVSSSGGLTAIEADCTTDGSVGSVELTDCQVPNLLPVLF